MNYVMSFIVLFLSIFGVRVVVTVRAIKVLIRLTVLAATRG